MCSAAAPLAQSSKVEKVEKVEKAEHARAEDVVLQGQRDAYGVQVDEVTHGIAMSWCRGV